MGYKEETKRKYMDGEKSMLRIAMLYGHETGVEYYRLLQPAKWLNRLSLCEVRPYSLGKRMPIMRYDKKSEDSICLEEICEWADVIVSARVAELENLSMLGGIWKTYNKPVVCELDDDVTCIRRDHPGYRNLKKKNTSELIDRVRIKRSEYKSYERAMKILDTAEIPNHPDEIMIMVMKGLDAEWIAQEQVAKSSAVTVTTESIKKSYLPFNKNIYILKNCIDFELWEGLLPPAEKTRLRIGWAGGMQHNKDMDIIVPVIDKILKKYPDVEFHYTNCMSQRMAYLHEYNKDRIHKYDWVALKSWPQSYSDYNFDIALAPVESTKFNKGKSNLKWLENSALKIPTVASRWDTYASIKDGETGYLADSEAEWIEKVSKLVESAELRRTIGENAYNDVKTNFNARDNALMYSVVYNHIKNHYKEMSYGFREEDKILTEVGITCANTA